MREAVTRISLERGAWIWLLLEPGEHVVFLMLWHGLIQHHLIPGINAPLFIGVGVLSFFMMRSVATRGMDAISANMALFSYRQIKAIDTVLARAFLEGFLYLLICVLLIAGCGLFGVDISMKDPLRVLFGFFMLWSLGLGLALTFSACAKLVPEVGQIVKMSFGPIYYMSATLYPSSWIPASVRPLFFMNPIVSGVEMIRAGFFEAYHEPDLVSPAYLGICSLVLVVSGLFLHARFGRKLVER
ncbi:ABC transporter permease [Caballeronia temeraria]|uniref:ABC transporter permease n=1 Tax=Caballeronia temeraria TaxID=1777137 RepID=UPI001FCA16CA|nr:ABC transporter permease [Caballeronia temeraria]